jgi:hypothetical protein
MGGISAPNVALGIGQTWQNVSGSRANGVTYTNTTGRSIEVALSAWSSTQTGTVYVGGAATFQGLGRSTYFDTLPISFVVPAGATYSTAGLDYLGTWFELRT